MTLAKSFVFITIAYVVALFFAGISLYFLDFNPLLDAFIADLIATTIIFCFSVYFKNSSFYDAYWSVIPPFLLLYWLAVSEIEIPFLRLFLVSAVVLFWATRLTLNWAYHWHGMQHEDWRYVMLKNDNPKKAMTLDYFGIHVFPTLQVFAGMLPVYALICLGNSTINILDFIAAIVAFGAVTVQMIADLQLDKFNANKKLGDIIETGLWSWSRHPNYFGEIGFWFGIYLFGLAALPNVWASAWLWMGIGFVAMTIMFVVVSIPMMEKRSLEKRPKYQSSIDRISMIVPLPPKAS
jgi:steroid 5-alpha reductase family enzyme